MAQAPCFRGKIHTGGRNQAGNTVKYKVFPGGFVACMGANSPSGLAGESSRIQWADEIDRYASSIQKEGDPLQLFWNRAGSFADAIFIESSTPTVKGISRIEADFEASDKRRWFCICPSCGENQFLKWDRIDFGARGFGNVDDPRYICENQGCTNPAWDDQMREGAIRAGDWQATAAFHGIAGFHLNGIYSLRHQQRGFKNRMHEMVVKYLEAKRGGRETLKVWINTFLAEPSIEELEVIEASEVNSRNEKYDADIPDGPLLLTVGGDVQKDRIEAEIVGFRGANETWGIENLYARGNTAKPEVWEEFEEWLFKIRYRADGTAFKVACTLLDSGHFTNYAYGFCDKNKYRRIFPCKGSSTPGSPLVTYSQNIRGLVLVGTEAAKEEIYNSLKIVDPGAGYAHFGYRERVNDLGYDDEFFEQLTAERIETTYTKGRRVRRFICPEGKRNEALDKRVYAMAACALLNPNWEALAKNLAVKAKVGESNGNANAPTIQNAPVLVARMPQRKRSGSNWTKKW